MKGGDDIVPFSSSREGHAARISVSSRLFYPDIDPGCDAAVAKLNKAATRRDFYLQKGFLEVCRL